MSADENARAESLPEDPRVVVIRDVLLAENFDISWCDYEDFILLAEEIAAALAAADAVPETETVSLIDESGHVVTSFTREIARADAVLPPPSDAAEILESFATGPAPLCSNGCCCLCGTNDYDGIILPLSAHDPACAWRLAHEWLKNERARSAVLSPPPSDAVRPEQIVEQRAKGWTDFHPETYCHRCGSRNIDSWFVSSALWKAAHIEDEVPSAIVCPQCFVEKFVAAEAGDVSWELRADPCTLQHMREDLRAANDEWLEWFRAREPRVSPPPSDTSKQLLMNAVNEHAATEYEQVAWRWRFEYPANPDPPWEYGEDRGTPYNARWFVREPVFRRVRDENEGTK